MTYSNWQAEWIRIGWGNQVPLLRCIFFVDAPVVKAVLRGTALGVCELRLNGEKVGDTHLLPGWTDYRKRLYYHEFDVTGQITAGKNVFGAILAPGWFAGFFGPFNDKGYYGHDAWFSAELELNYTDGSTELIRTGETWKGADSPIRSADLLMGEHYDARCELPEWDQPDFDDRKWIPVRILRCGEERLPERIEKFPGAPVKTIAELSTVNVSEPHAGVFVFDLGQNMVGVVRINVNVCAGTELIIKYGEMLNADGTAYTANLRFAKAVDRYTAKGGGKETWQPRFTFHGFRYVEIHGLSEKPALKTVTGLVWMSALKETATFECSNEKVNQLFRNIQWGFRGNYLEVPTDCPQRDERLGWTGDAQMFIRSASYLADIRPFFKKWLIDLHDAQHETGGYPDMAPFMGRMNYASAAWSDAGIICPYVLWQAYGDLEFIRPWWPQMKKFMQLICSENNSHNGTDAVSYGDWLHFNSETPVRLIGLAYRAYDAQLMQEMAGALGAKDDAEIFYGEAEQSRLLFRNCFFAGNEIAVKTQTACSLAIAMDLLDGEDLEKTKECLIRLLEDHDGYLTTGFVGTAYLCPALTKSGRHDLAVQLLLNEGYPSWLYEVNNGATTIWERWNSWTKENGFGDVGMNSFNHYAFGAVCEWMFESLAGIRPAAPGFKRITIAPGFTDRLDFVRASYNSVAGKISVEWEKTAGGFMLKLVTPAEADVKLPGGQERVGAGEWSWEVKEKS
ncbi:MAG: family 78 glycoside hydrolase catalytic domain [Kiritimatiellales bacterium]